MGDVCLENPTPMALYGGEDYRGGVTEGLLRMNKKLRVEIQVSGGRLQKRFWRGGPTDSPTEIRERHEYEG